MEPKKAQHLSVRLSQIKPLNISSTSAATSSESKDKSIPSAKNVEQRNVDSSTDSESDDIATVHFNLATALQAAAAHASGLKFDWQIMKNGLISGATAASTSLKSVSKKPISTNATSSSDAETTASALEDAGNQDSYLEQIPKVISKDKLKFVFNSTESHNESSNETSVSSDDDDVSNILLPLFSKPFSAAMQFSKLTSITGIVGGVDESPTSVLDDPNPMTALAKILDRMPYNPFDADLVQVQFVFKSIISLTQLSLRENNVIEVEIKKSSIIEYSKDKIDRALSPFMDVSNIQVKHNSDEFFTFCSCKKCLEYREIVFHIMMEQFKAAHMVVMLLDVLIKAYGPMLKNVTAYNKFEKLLDTNKDIYWITCGFIYNKKSEQLDFIYDESLSDNMILVLFSSILMANNPILLLQILSFHIECIVKAYAEGFMEIVEPDKSEPNKTPAEEMLMYVLDGYDDLCRISEHISSYLYAFENDFLHRISLTWSLLCQRLYQHHVYMNLTDTMLGCIITLKEDEMTTKHTALIKRYIQFDDKMNYVDRCWSKAWIELNKINLSDRERKRRKCLLDVYHIFDTVVQDAIAFSLQESGDDNDFYDFESLEDRRLAWQNIMAYTKMKWPDGFFRQPNTLVCDEKCKKCFTSVEYHKENCKCITCSIAGGPQPPKRNADNTCYKCLAHSLVDKEVNLYESKILNVCASYDFFSFVKNNCKRKSTILEQLNEEMTASMTLSDKRVNTSPETDGMYHISWAVYKHLNDRKQYKHSTLEEKFFCKDCILPGCMIAQKILNNEISRDLSVLLIHYFQPFVMSRDELRSVLPNIMLYNRKMLGSNSVRPVTDMNDFVVKNYWTFVISLYATKFLDLNNKTPLNLNHFEISQNDVGFRINYKTLSIGIEGNKNDTHFLDFLNKLKSLSPYSTELMSEINVAVDAQNEEFYNKLDNFLNAYEQNRNIQSPLKLPITNMEEEVTANPNNSKKPSREKPKKCCFDHPDLGDHCKENHIGKKRIKKECNHVRINETRDRLRKKLSQLVNARKDKNAGIATAIGTVAETLNVPTENSIKQPLTLKSVAGAASINNANNKDDGKNDSLECLNSLCKRISHLHTCKSNTRNDINILQASNKKLNLSAISSGITGFATTKQFSNNIGIKDSKTARSCLPALNINNGSNDCNNIMLKSTNKLCEIDVNVMARSSLKKDKDNALDVSDEICEFIDNYSKDQSKVKKWINETLSFIEGSNLRNTNGKKQPQPKNPKKAAKKAKQKQRKEEEKRIMELQDLRGQFHDIYFKEFTDKLELKALKANKKRDKRKIADLETNIKKLQRAKSKVETAILELIATVKQTNTDFKFPYLPTKEQQLEKLKQIEMSANGNGTASALSIESIIKNTPKHISSSNVSTVASTAIATKITSDSIVGASKVNDLNINPSNNNFILPYARVNQFPYQPHHIDFASNAPNTIGNNSFGIIRPNLPAPMCYAPPKRQQLPPDVVAAMTANAACSSTIDPSKRIVTIRRINLPNVPEPQVTVTAKGSSPDKDKLLYTFVNGQLVQTDANSSLSLPLPMNSIQSTLNLCTERAESTNIVHSQSISKTQLKKERRRLAKLANAESQIVAESSRNNQGKIKSTNNIKLVSVNNNNNNKNQKKECATTKDYKSEKLKPSMPAEKKKKHQNSGKMSFVRQSASFSSVSTVGASSGSVGTSSALGTPMNSTVNTRDNSVCSLKPVGNTVAKKSVEMSQNSKSENKQLVNNTKKLLRSNLSLAQEAKCSHTSNASENTGTANYESQVKVTNTKSIRPKCKKIIDNGKFDNNPFKSLHIHESESDSEWESSSLCNGNYLEVAQKRPPYKGNVEQNKQEIIKSKTNNIKIVPPKKEVKSVTIKKTSQKPILKENTITTTREEKKYSNATTKRNSQLFASGKNAANEKNELAHAKEQPKLRVPVKQNTKSDVTTKSRSQQEQQIPGNFKSDKRYATHNRRIDSGRGQTNSSAVNNSHGNSNTQSMSYSRLTNNRLASQNSSIEAPHVPAEGGKTLSKRAQKQAQRNKKFQNYHHPHQLQNYKPNDPYIGIPEHMGYFNPNEIFIPQTHSASQFKQNTQRPVEQEQKQQNFYNSLTQQIQAMHIDPNNSQHNPPASSPSYARVSNSYGLNPDSNLNRSPLSNVSIMDQLNRGVQVENLSLPPGITLTKVDPAKSEQLRQRSESIKKLSQPLQSNTSGPQAIFHHPGATIIAPPGATVANYFGAPYAGVVAGGLDQGIIMVEGNNPSATSGRSTESAKLNVVSTAAAAAASASRSHGKTSKSKKRRNKAKSENTFSNSNSQNNTSSNASGVVLGSSHKSEMITLRNPMFHGGSMSAATSILQQPGRLARPLDGLPLPTPLPMDQPAAIIKNENGMFTIRNPALHQAVTNGIALGGYRQFGNVNYYTPQEAAAEAVRATQAQQNADVSINTESDSSSFSYFSGTGCDTSLQIRTDNNTENNGSIANNLNSNVHKTINISCTSVDKTGANVNSNKGSANKSVGIISRPTQQQKCLSAIGSEMKSAQQKKQKCKEHQQSWSSFGSDLGQTMQHLNVGNTDNMMCGTDSLVAVDLNSSTLQEKYQQSSYYNGFHVFSAKGGSGHITSSLSGSLPNKIGSLFENTDCQMHHNCDDDSPPPTITGYNSYLEGIPNTGVIRYDDASFLKNLIPGQNLNDEVSIHNVNDTNFMRNSTSPIPHHVEITPVYANQRTSANMYEQCSIPSGSQPLQPSASNNYCDNLSDYSNDTNLFGVNNLLNLNKLGESRESTESYKVFNYDFDSSTEKQKVMLNLNDLLVKNPDHSQSTSPYLDESTLENFVQCMNTLQISAPPNEQCLNLNGISGGDGACSGSSNGDGDGSAGGRASGSASCGPIGSGGVGISTNNGWW